MATMDYETENGRYDGEISFLLSLVTNFACY